MHAQENHSPAPRPRPTGFTLVELLVVITIIGILAALITTAAIRALGAAKEGRIKLEVDQLNGAMQQYKAKYGSFPPSWRPISPGQADAIRSHVASLFPRALPQDIAQIPDRMTAAEALWFFLRGYTTDPQRPVDFYNTQAKRDNFLDFDKARLVATRAITFNGSPALAPPRVSPQPVYCYVAADGKGQPYVYFDTSRKVYGQENQDPRVFPPLTLPAEPALPSAPVALGVIRPYYRTYFAANDNRNELVNADSFQILSAGLDGDWGDYPTANLRKVFPTGVNYRTGDNDNLASFSGKNLENSKP